MIVRSALVKVGHRQTNPTTQRPDEHKIIRAFVRLQKTKKQKNTRERKHGRNARSNIKADIAVTCSARESVRGGDFEAEGSYPFDAPFQLVARLDGANAFRGTGEDQVTGFKVVVV